jgi:hypothetical protein
MPRRHALVLAILFGLPALNWGGEPLRGPLVVSERWPECTNLETWTRDVMRLDGVEHASETEQAKSFFHWLRLFSRMATGGMIQAYEGDYGAERYVTDAQKNLFVYGWGYCDTTSRIAEAAWTTYKGRPGAAERVVVQHDNGGYHTMYRLNLNGRWAAFDPRYGYYLIDRDAKDARILDWSEVGANHNVRKNRAYHNRSAPFFEFFGLEWERAQLIHPGFFSSEREWRAAGAPKETVFGDPAFEPGRQYHNMDFELPRHARIERFWDNSARAFYVPAGKHALKEEPFLPSGRFYRVTETMFDGNWPKHDPNYRKAEPYLASVPTNEGYGAVAGGRTIGQAWGRITLQPDFGEAGIFDYRSPYILVGGRLEGTLPGKSRLEWRTLRPKPSHAATPDEWSEWEVLEARPGPFSIDLGRSRFNGKTRSLHGVYRFQVRCVGAPLAHARMTMTFENGIMSLPQIFAGKNRIHFKVRDSRAVDAPIEVTYRYDAPQGVQERRKTLHREDFRGNTADYEIDAPGLIRCRSVAIEY